VLALALLISDAGSLLWYLVTVAAGLYCFVRGLALLSRRRLILSTPQSKIRSASLGLVEVSGLATGPYTLNAPITGLPCFYYRTIAWEHKQSGRDNIWEKVAEETLYVPFFLDDNTGKLLVDPRGAELDLHRDFRHEFSDSIFSSADPVPYNARNFLLRHGVSCESKLRLEEFCIKPKNALFIIGTLAANPGYRTAPMSGYRPSLTVHKEVIDENGPAVPEVIYLSHGARTASTMRMTQQEKVAAALLKAGITKPAAWDAAGISLSSVAVQTTPVEDTHTSENGYSKAATIDDGSASPEFDLDPPVILMKGKNDKTLVISWRSESALAKTLGWKAALMLSGGPTLILLGLYVLLARLELL
jgi:E3 Ubiquitin ligase